MNKKLDSLTEYPFYFLRELLSAVENNDEERLKGILIGELSKPSFEQSKTPTQLVNDFLFEVFDINFSLTPASFGEQGHKLIMEWGIQKSSDMNEE